MSAAQRAYWTRLIDLGCIVMVEDYGRCRSPAEIAHCHGGSIVERTHEPKAKGEKLARNDWLVLPVCPAHHRWSLGLDLGVAAWEARHGTQASYIDALCQRFGLDLWRLAQEGRKFVGQFA